MGVDLGIWRYRKDLEPGKKRAGGKEAMKSVTFYTWDFGGQEEYYVTHQCFLSTRSLYLVVWDVEKGEEGIDQLGPWLHNIQVSSISGWDGQFVDGIDNLFFITLKYTCMYVSPAIIYIGSCSWLSSYNSWYTH